MVIESLEDVMPKGIGYKGERAGLSENATPKKKRKKKAKKKK